MSMDIGALQTSYIDVGALQSTPPTTIAFSGSFNLFLHGNTTKTNNLNLFTIAGDFGSNNLDLIIFGYETSSGTIELFVNGIGVENDTVDFIDLFISGPIYTDADCDLVINGRDTKGGDVDLFIRGFNDLSGNLNLFVHGGYSESSQTDLIINGLGAQNQSIELFISGPSFASINNNMDLFIHGLSENLLVLSLFINGYENVDNLGNIDLFIRGSIGSIPISCPALDPTLPIQISDELIGIYQSRIDALINQLGKNVILEFDPIVEPCVNCFQNTIEHRSNGVYKSGGPIPFSRGQKCPYCKGHGFLERKVEKCIKCLIQWRPQDAKNYGISTSDSKDIVRLKTFLTSGDDLIKAKTAIVNHDISDILKLRVRLIRGPVIVGLRESRYIITFWELI